MSEVRAARHRFLGDRVAIKLLRAHLAQDPEATAAFLAEATRSRAIAHPKSCGDRLRQRRRRLLPRDGAGVRRELAARLDGRHGSTRRSSDRWGGDRRRLAAAHDHGIVHRDLKPGTSCSPGHAQDRRLRIARTFGGGARDGDRLAGRHARYMAPSRSRRPHRSVHDVWALGVVLYEASPAGCRSTTSPTAAHAAVRVAAPARHARPRVTALER